MRLFHFLPFHALAQGNVLLRVIPATIFLLLYTTTSIVQAQNYPSGPTSLSPAVQPVYKVNKRTREVKRVQPNVKHSAEYQFYERVQQAAKSKKRALRKLARPQYTNPLYFGHKSPPKKRAPYKMRFCDECGIRH